MKKKEEVPSFPPSITVGGSKEYFPFCLVWSPLPFFTAVVPFIGHVGIGDSKGRLYDFQGNFSIGRDRMLFGKAVKYLDLSRKYVPSAYTVPPGPREAILAEIEAFDKKLEQVVKYFRETQEYSFLRNNCHDFVASVLNAQESTVIDNSPSTSFPSVWSVKNIMWTMLLKGKYVSRQRFFKAHQFSLVFYSLIIGILLFWAIY